MKERIRILLTAATGLLVFPAAAAAQDEQWLQYHCRREAQTIITHMATKTPQVTEAKPQDVELPEFKASRQFFAQWSTPMVPSGRLWIALDQTKEQGRWDRLFTDSNGNDRLDDETAVTAYRIEQYYTYFGPVKVVFESEDGPIVYHLNIRFYSSGENRRLYVRSGCWYEGDITVAGKDKHCLLVDHNANGTFNDKALGSRNSNRIRIGDKNSKDAGCVGNYIDIDGVLYEPEIARDGAYVKLTKAENVEFGDILLPESISQFAAGGENGLFILNKLEKGAGSLPVGKYRIRDWITERKDEQGRLWKLKGTGFTVTSAFDINSAKQTQLSIGEPIISTMSARKRDDTYSFSQDLKGRFDESIELTRNGAQPQAPKVRIRNTDGTYDRTYSFSYG